MDLNTKVKMEFKKLAIDNSILWDFIYNMAMSSKDPEGIIKTACNTLKYLKEPQERKLPPISKYTISSCLGNFNEKGARKVLDELAAEIETINPPLWNYLDLSTKKSNDRKKALDTAYLIYGFVNSQREANQLAKEFSLHPK